MSVALNERCKRFFVEYGEVYETYKSCAIAGQTFVAQVLSDGGLTAHAITGRAKEPESLLRKLRRKAYENPVAEITDAVGIRVITYFRDEVDRGVGLLRPRMTVDEGNSVDKRGQLDLREFGYRSVHLVGRLGDIGLAIPEEFVDRPFEVQVRSILEHAWAENEHEIVYKSGIKFPQTTSRGFAAVAGALELLDQEFERFRLTVTSEVDTRVDLLRADPSAWAVPFDAASLIATMECLAPANPGWRAETGALPPKSAALAFEALVAAGLTTPQALRLGFDAGPFRAALANFAALAGVAQEGVSHLALGALLAATQPAFPIDDFPDFLNDQMLVDALELRPAQ